MNTCFKIIAFLFFTTSLSFAQSDDLVEGEIIIQLNDDSNIKSFFEQRSISGIESYKILSSTLDIYLLNYNPEITDYKSLEEKLKGNKGVNYVFQNRNVQQRAVPNDQHFDKQWNLSKIQAEKAWDVTTGGETALGDEIVVAIMDSGFDTDLPDLFPNILYNTNEPIGDANNDGCPGLCGIDDDKDGLIDEDGKGREPGEQGYDPNFVDDDDENGYIDDARGLNLNNYSDDHPALNHGTSVAGIIGAVGNNGIGVTGINWKVKLLLLSEVGNVGEIIEAYEYIYNKRRIYNETNGEKGAYVVVTNFSSGINNEFGTSFPLWCQMYDQLGSIGVLSVGATTNKDTNVDVEGDMPTTCQSEYLITVTNVNKEDQQPNSGYGQINIDLAAPGNGAITLALGEIDNVGQFSGTSSATPHVSGSLALLHSIPCEEFAQYFKSNPSRVAELKDYLLESVRPIPDLVNRTVTEGALDVYTAMVALRDFCPSESKGTLEIANVYPNPSFQEELTIEYDGPDEAENYEFLIYDFMGKLIYSKSFVPPLYGKRELKYTPREMTGGAYVLVIRNNDDIVARKHVFIPSLR